MFDGSYDIHDLIDANRVIDYREENQRRAAAANAEHNRRNSQ